MSKPRHYEIHIEGCEETIIIVAASAAKAKMAAVEKYSDAFWRMNWPKLKARRMSAEEVRMATEFPSEEVQ